MKNVRFMVQAALIAAVYIVVTVSFAPISSGLFQLRFSEALTVLPALTTAAIPGLFIGCLLGNFLVGATFVDVIFGSLTTLAAAYMSYKLRGQKWLVPMPPVILNAIVVGIMLVYVYAVPIPLPAGLNAIPGAALLVAMGWVALGQIAACYVIGYPLMNILGRYKDRIFKM